MPPTGPEQSTHRRREAPEVRRSQILDAAEQTLAARGLAATTVDDVAVAAGIAKGTVYLHFESKLDLISALRTRHVERFRDCLASALSGAGRAKAPARLDRFIDEFFDYSTTHHALHHLLFHEAGFNEDDGFAEVRALLRDFIVRGMQSGEFATGDADLVTDFLISGIHGALMTALHTPGGDRAKYIAGAKQLSRRVVAA